MDIQSRLFEKAFEAAQRAVDLGLKRNSHKLVPNSFAALAFETRFDQLQAAKAKACPP